MKKEYIRPITVIEDVFIQSFLSTSDDYQKMGVYDYEPESEDGEDQNEIW